MHINIDLDQLSFQVLIFLLITILIKPDLVGLSEKLQRFYVQIELLKGKLTWFTLKPKEPARRRRIKK